MGSPIVARAAIEIQAPIAVVWAILLELTAYKDWNPFIVEVRDIRPPNEPIAEGTQFTLYCKYSDGSTSTSREKVYEVTPPGEQDGVSKAVLEYGYAGALATLGVVNGTRYQWLEQDAAGGSTRYRTEETFRGIGALFVPVAGVQDGFKRMAAALKLRAESMSPP